MEGILKLLNSEEEWKNSRKGRKKWGMEKKWEKMA
jgi:hypothetical protein